jgi:hypothetical protein
MNIPSEVRPTTEALIDRHLKKIAESLGALSWMDRNFVRAYRHRFRKDGTVQPFVYVGNDEYLPVMPDDELGNYSFVYVEEGDQISDQGDFDMITSQIRIICFWNFESIFQNEDRSNLMTVVKMIKDQLHTTRFLYARMELTSTFLEVDSIFQGFTASMIDDSKLSFPFGACRIDAELKYLDVSLNCP